jgi:hypothetical protein
MGVLRTFRTPGGHMRFYAEDVRAHAAKSVSGFPELPDGSSHLAEEQLVDERAGTANRAEV